MPEKPSSTNAPVSGSGENLNQTQSGEGKSPSEKEIENRIRENLRAEYERKNEANQAKLQEQLEETQARLDELTEKTRLTAAEKAEKEHLENKVEGLEEGLYKLENDPQYAVINEKFKRTKAEAIATATEAVKKELVYENSVQLTNLYLEMRAEKEGVTVEALEKEIEAVLKSDHDYFKRMLPFDRAKKALAIRSRDLAYNKKLKELEEKEKKGNDFSDDSNTRAKTEKNISELIKDGDIDAALSRI